MQFIKNQTEYVKARPAMVGVFAVLATLSVGMALSFALGFTSPLNAFAQFAPPCNCGGGSGGIGVGGLLPPGGVDLLPASCQFTATDTKIAPGDSTTISWSNIGAAGGFSIDQGIGKENKNSGSITVSPTVTTTYTGTPIGTSGSGVPCTITIVVVPPPSCTLSAAPASITQGDSSALSWSTTNGSTFSIDNGIGAVTHVDAGSTNVTPSSSVTYTGTVTNALGVTATCSTPITVTPPPVVPPLVVSCAAAPSPANIGDTVTWTATASGGDTDDPYQFAFSGTDGLSQSSYWDYATFNYATAGTKTATVVVTDAAGTTATATCNDTITPPPNIPNAPTCTLSASPTLITTGGSSVLTWTTTNADTFTIDNSIGAETPVAGGTQSVSPGSTTTYTGTATGAGGTVTCSATITVTPPNIPNAPTCTLSALPSSVFAGGQSTLTWATTNATSFSLDNGIGAVGAAAVAGASLPVTVATTTTYVGTAVGPGGTVTCTTVITVTPPNSPNPPSCTLSVDPTSTAIGGGAVTLTWATTFATTFSIDNGIGSIMPVSAGTTTATVTGTTTFTGTATGAGGSVICTAVVTVPPPSNPGCVSGCGGGGGGGGHPVNVTLTQATNQPLAFVYLSQIPYTGLDLGPVGTFLYWLLLALWSAALAYLAIFKLVPFVTRRMKGFGSAVAEALNADAARDEAPASYAAYAASAPYAASSAAYASAAPRAAPPQPVMQAAATAAPEAHGRYSAYDGFRSFGRGGALSIDDIVKGLSRMPAQSAPASASAMTEPVIAENAEPVYENVEPIYDRVEPIAYASCAANAAQAKPAASAAPVAAEVPHFIALILAGNRDEAFAMIRTIVREGGDSENFLTQAACALDDAYRARVDGTPVNAEIARVTNGCATPFLEKLVSSLSTAVDSTYSQGITGAKLAVARALAVAGA